MGVYVKAVRDGKVVFDKYVPLQRFGHCLDGLRLDEVEVKFKLTSKLDIDKSKEDFAAFFEGLITDDPNK